MNYWIFQSRPDRFDLRQPDALVPGTTDAWDATRYRAYMQPKDIVFFWLSGDPSWKGIYGWGELLSLPFTDGGTEDFAVSVLYKGKLTHPLLISQIRAEKELANLQILKIPIGTNFRINRSEATAISDLIRQHDEAPEIGS